MNRPVARVLGALTAVITLAFGCGDGTSGWVLTRNHSSPPSGSGATSGTTNAGSGGFSAGGSTAAAGKGGNSAGAGGDDSAAAGAGGEGAVSGGPRDPDDFAAVCSPTVTIDNRTATGNGQLFTEALPEPEAFMIAAARRSCALLYKLPAEVPVTDDLTVIIDDYDGPGSLGVSGASSTLRLSSLHMRSIADAGGDVTLEVSGVSQFLIALDYAHEDEDPGALYWLHSGLGDWVRFAAGFTPVSSRGPGGTWTDGFKTTGFFVDWLDQTYVDAAYRINQSLDEFDGVPWSDQVFMDIGGSDVATLWSEYQATL